MCGVEFCLSVGGKSRERGGGVWKDGDGDGEEGMVMIIIGRLG